MKKGDRVEINSPKSFEFHGCKATVMHVIGNRVHITTDWGGMKDFSPKSLKVIQ